MGPLPQHLIHSADVFFCTKSLPREGKQQAEILAWVSDGAVSSSSRSYREEIQPLCLQLRERHHVSSSPLMVPSSCHPEVMLGTGSSAQRRHRAGPYAQFWLGVKSLPIFSSPSLPTTVENP